MIATGVCDVCVHRFLGMLGMHWVIEAVVPAFGDNARVPCIVPGQDPRPLGLGARGPTPGTNGWGIAGRDKGEGVQPNRGGPQDDCLQRAVPI